MTMQIQVTQDAAEPRWRLDIMRWADGQGPPNSADASARLYLVVDEFSTSTSEDVEDLLVQLSGWIVAGADKPVEVTLRKSVDSTTSPFQGDNL